MDYAQLLEYVSKNAQAHPWAVYATLAGIATANGRFAALVAGTFIAPGYVNPITAYVIFVVMDFAGDTLYYTIGRVGHLGGKLLMRKRKSGQNKLRRLHHEGWEKNLGRVLFIGKITGVSKPIIIAAGVAKMPLGTFWKINVPCTLVSFVLYMVAGYFFGQWIFQWIS